MPRAARLRLMLATLGGTLLAGLSCWAWTEYLIRAPLKPTHAWLTITIALAGFTSVVWRGTHRQLQWWQLGVVLVAVGIGLKNWFDKTADLHRTPSYVAWIGGSMLWIPAWQLLTRTKTWLAVPLLAATTACGWHVARNLVLEGLDGQGRAVLQLRWVADRSQENPPSGVPKIVIQEEIDAGLRFPSFRNGGSGVVDTEIPDDAELKEVWRVQVGVGWSGCVLSGDRVFLHDESYETELTRCLSLRDGSVIWQVSRPHSFYRPLSGPGPRATPALSESHLVTLGADGLLECRSQADGELAWQTSILNDQQTESTMHGVIGSPLIADDQVIVTAGGQGAAVASYDLATGKVRWKAGDDLAGYSSPALVELHGSKQIVVLHRHTVAGYSLDGRRLWSHPYENDDKTNAVQPLAAGNRIMLSSGYGREAELIEVPANEGAAPRLLWKAARPQTKFASGVVRDGHLFALDNGILCCVDLQDGRRVWRAGRYGHGGQMLLAGDKLLIQCESGHLALVRARVDAHEELGRWPALRHRTWNTPCLASGWVVVRNDREAACFRLESDSQDEPGS